MEPSSSPISSFLRPMWTKQLPLSATHWTWAWLVGQAAKGPDARNGPDLSTATGLRPHSALGSPAFFLTSQDTVTTGKMERNKKYIYIYFFRDLFCLLPPPWHRPSLPLPQVPLFWKSLFSRVFMTLALPFTPIPRPTPFLSVDFLLHGDVIGVKAGIVHIYRILSVCHTLC